MQKYLFLFIIFILVACKGKDGEQGKEGVDGLIGKEGKIGLTGSKGSKGLTGKEGKEGLTGKEGNIGLTGKEGNIGLTGKEGKIGLTGKEGKIGLTGKEGNIGLTGKEGKEGLTGKEGNIGLTGKEGERGANYNEMRISLIHEKGWDGINIPFNRKPAFKLSNVPYGTNKINVVFHMEKNATPHDKVDTIGVLEGKHIVNTYLKPHTETCDIKKTIQYFTNKYKNNIDGNGLYHRGMSGLPENEKRVHILNRQRATFTAIDGDDKTIDKVTIVLGLYQYDEEGKSCPLPPSIQGIRFK